MIEVKSLIVLFCFVLNKAAEGALVESPKNFVATVNTTDAKFTCKSNQGFELKWFLQPNDTSLRMKLSDGTNINTNASSYCEIENEEDGKFDLNLDVKDESAQTYTCHEPDTNEEASADLIKIGSTSSREESNSSHVVLSCAVDFRGNWAPQLDWIHQNALIVHGINVSIIPNRNVSSILIFQRCGSKYGGNYTCITRFDIRGKPQQTTDTVVPSYSQMSTVIVVVPDPLCRMSCRKVMELVIGVAFATLVLGVAIGIGIGLYAGYYRREKQKKENMDMMLKK